MAIVKTLIVKGVARFLTDAYMSTIRSGIWNGSTIQVGYGGTGVTSAKGDLYTPVFLSSSGIAACSVSIPHNTKDFKINGTTYSIFTTYTGTAPTIFAPTTLAGTGGYILATNSAKTGLEWVAKPVTNVTTSAVVASSASGTTQISTTQSNPFYNLLEGGVVARSVQFVAGPGMLVGTTDGSDIKITNNAPIYYVVGNDSDTAGVWTGTCSEISAYYNGLTIMYVPKVAGASSTNPGTTLKLNNLAAINCYTNNTSKLTTHYAANTPILFTYYEGFWRRADYDSNSNTWRGIRVNNSGSDNVGTGTGTKSMNFASSNLTINYLAAGTGTGQSGNANYFTINLEAKDWVGATSSTAGTAGYMPGASTSDRLKYLRGDGSWIALAPSISAGTTDTNKIKITIGGENSSEFTVPFATSSTDAKYLNMHTVSTSAYAVQDLKLKWSRLSAAGGYAGDNTGFPVNNNANGILWLGNHSGSYGGQLGISSNGYIYYRFISSGSFPTTANGGSWKRVAFTSDLSNTWRNIYTEGTSRVGTGTGTKAMNFAVAGNLSVSYLAAGTNTGQSGSADYFTVKITANANAVDVAGYVAAPTAADNKHNVWMTNANGAPAWRAVTVPNSVPTIGTSATTIATIGGITIQAKIGSYASSSHTHYYLETSGDHRSVVTAPNDYANKFTFVGLKNNTTLGISNAGTYSYLIGLRGWSDNSGGYSHELAFNQILGLLRRREGESGWESWIRIADSSNISNKAATIGTTLTTIATIAGVDITAKIPDVTAQAAELAKVTKTLVVSTWTDMAAVNGYTGTYAIQISSGNVMASGVFTACGGTDSVIDEIPLHVADKGTNTWRPYARISAGQLQMTTNEATGTSREYTIKILKLI